MVNAETDRWPGLAMINLILWPLSKDVDVQGQLL